MKNKKNKQELLNTPMNQLGLGKAFDNWFHNESIQQSEVLTLSEFIALNQSLRSKSEVLVCWRDNEIKSRSRRGLDRGLSSFKNLKSFLLKNKFTHKDWVLLLPNVKTAKGMLPNLSLLDKKTLIELPYCQVTNIKSSCNPARRILYYFVDTFGYSSDRTILVKDILSLTGDQINTHFSDKLIETTFFSIQNKFKTYGLTEDDGPFMKLNLPLTKSKEDYVNDLVNNRGFAKKDAQIAVELGIKAGWITV